MRGSRQTHAPQFFELNPHRSLGRMFLTLKQVCVHVSLCPRVLLFLTCFKISAAYSVRAGVCIIQTDMRYYVLCEYHLIPGYQKCTQFPCRIPFCSRHEVSALTVNVVSRVRETRVLQKLALLFPLYCNELNS